MYIFFVEFFYPLIIGFSQQLTKRQNQNQYEHIGDSSDNDVLVTVSMMNLVIEAVIFLR
jgi:hypothetical protein